MPRFRYLEFDPEDPTKNRFGLILKNLVLQTIFDAFVPGAVTLPEFIADNGFPDTVTLSYNPIGEWTPVPGITFPSGFYFKGAFKFLELSGSAEIAVDTTAGFKLDLALSPIKFPPNSGEFFTFAQSSAALNNGPFLKIDAMGSNMITPKINGSGYVNILSGLATAQAIVEISVPNIMKISLEASLYLLKASVNVTSYLAEDFQSFSYAVQFRVTGLDTFAKLIEQVRAAISGAFQEGSRQIDAANADLQLKQDNITRLERDICDHEKCVSRSSAVKCSQQVTVWHCVEVPCQWWESWDCFWGNVKKVFCDAAHAIAEVVCQGWDTIVTVTTDFACQAICDVATAALEFAKGVLETAQGFLAGVKETFALIDKAFNFLADILTSFTISTIDGGLYIGIEADPAETNAALDGRLDLTIVGSMWHQPFTQTLQMNTKDMAASALALVEGFIWPLLKRAFGIPDRRLLERDSFDILAAHNLTTEHGGHYTKLDPKKSDMRRLDRRAQELIAGSKLYRLNDLANGPVFDLQFLSQSEDEFLEVHDVAREATASEEARSTPAIRHVYQKLQTDGTEFLERLRKRGLLAVE